MPELALFSMDTESPRVEVVADANTRFDIGLDVLVLAGVSMFAVPMR